MNRLVYRIGVISIIWMMLLSWECFAQAFQHGVVMEYREGLSQKTLGGVEIEVMNANSTASGKNGKFLLEFRTCKAGQSVQVRNIYKSNYEVFNTEALEQWNINPQKPFVIKMVKRELFKRIKDEYSRVSSRCYKEQYDREVARYKRERDEHRISEEAYQREIIRLSKEYDRQLANMDNYIDRFARIDLSTISSEEREIIELVKAGKIDEAIKRYDNLNLIAQFEQNFADLAELKEAEKKIKNRIAECEEDSNELYNSINNQINLLMMSGGEENVNKVDEIYKQLLAIDNTNIKLYLRYINFCLEQTHYNEALACAEHLLTIVQTDEDRAIALNALGDAHSNLMNNYQAISALNNGHDIIVQLTEEDPNNINYRITNSNITNSIGLLGMNMNLIDDAISLLWFTYSLRTEIARIQPQNQNHHRLAITANELANIHMRVYDSNSAIKYSSEAISIYETLIESDETYLVDLAMSYSNKASIHYAIGQFDSAEPLFLKAIELYEKLVVTNPDRFRFDFAYTLTNYCLLLKESGRYDEAHQYFIRINEIYDSCEVVPLNMQVQQALYNLSMCDMFSKDEQSNIRENYNRMIDKIVFDFNDISCRKFAIDILAREFDALANMEHMDLVERKGESMIAFASESYNVAPSIYGVQYYKCLMKMGLFYIKYMEDLELAKRYFNQAKAIALQFKDDQYYTHYYVYSILAIHSLVYIYKCEDRWDEAMALIKENPDFASAFNLNDPSCSDEDILSAAGILESIDYMWNEVLRVDSIQLPQSIANIYAN